LLADDHDIVRNQVRLTLEQFDDCVICGEASNGQVAVELALSTKPDVAVLDIGMPEMNGFEATRKIRAALPDIEVVVLTVHYSEELVIEALKAGARGYVRKPDAARHLVAAVRAASRHEPYFIPELSQETLEAFLNQPSPDGRAIR
jgi:DNA-binding NarL/FixJ family response regulator